VIAADMPIGLIVPDGPQFEAVANGDGPPLGRELEIADLLRFICDRGIRNVVWLTADVHYTAAHYYDPAKARFKEFHPFWEFVSGPLNAGNFGPNTLDDTFGPQLKFMGLPEGTAPNTSPLDGLQFYGTVRIDGRSAGMRVQLHNLKGEVLYHVDLVPETGRRRRR
jgi:alkaline phosphatase D